MNVLLSRRSLLSAGFAWPLLGLTGCATVFDRFAYEEAVRRLLTLSTQRAFARLLQENGFYADDLARVALPAELGGAGTVAAALLNTSAVQDQLLRLVNRAAEVAAAQAAPVANEVIRTMTIAEAEKILRGAPNAGTDLLRRELGEGMFNAMLPGIGDALRLGDSALLDQALAAATGINFEGLRLDVARKASDAIYRAIEREEAAIRADPGFISDLVLQSAVGPNIIP